MRYFQVMILIFGFLAIQTSAETTNWYKIEKLTVGTNNLHGISVVLSGTNFNGCAISSAALIEASDPNYDGILSLLLAARLADKEVRITYVGCNGSYPKITEAQL